MAQNRQCCTALSTIELFGIVLKPLMAEYSGRWALAAAIILAAPVHLRAEYPLIRYTVEARDPLYSQQQQDVESWYADPANPPVPAIYCYVPRESEDIFAVAAAFNLPYESLATLNGWDAPGLMNSGSEMMVPNMPGIFVPQIPENGWEKLLRENRTGKASVAVLVRIAGDERRFLFHPGEKFSSDERIRFLGSIFSSPVGRVRVSSGFGYRTHPFHGGPSFHAGIDLRVPLGTSVKAAGDGLVADTGILESWGRFAIIDHKGLYRTVYAHLGEVLVSRGHRVKAGEIIALSGNSGFSTGPHLHFEIRRDGVPIDPLRITNLRDK